MTTVPPRISRIELAWLTIIAAVLLVIYLPGINSPLLFDDAILTDGTVASYGSLLQVRPRMISYGSFVWLEQLFGDGWWKQRLVNVALHLGVVGSLWGLYRELLRHIEPREESLDRSPALPVAIGFFALNPVAVYAIAYLVQRSIVMATLFVVMGLWLFAIAAGRGRPVLHVAALACYVAAVFSKEYALFAPAAAMPVYVIAARPDMKRLAAVGAGAALILGALGYTLLRFYGEILAKPFDEYSSLYLAQLGGLDPSAQSNAFRLSILNEASLFFHYGLRWMLPASEWLSISLRPPFPLTWSSLPHLIGAIGYVAVLVGASFMVWRYRDWRALVGFSLLAPALLFLTEFTTVWVQDPFVLYRSYLWGIGIPGLLFVLMHGTPGRVLFGIALVAGALLAWQASDRVISMSSPERAWSDAIRKLPDDPRAVGRWFAYLNRGAARVDRGQYNLAMEDFDASSRLGDQGAGLVNRGSLYAANGEHENALLSFAVAEREGYKGFNLPFQRGLSLFALGQPREAHGEFFKAWSMSPPSPARELVLLNMGRSALQAGLIHEAISALDVLTQLQPDNADARFYFAMAIVARKDYPRALKVLETFPANPPSSRAHYARALAHYGLQQRDKALAEIEAAIKIGPETPHLREWRNRIQAMK